MQRESHTDAGCVVPSGRRRRSRRLSVHYYGRSEAQVTVAMTRLDAIWDQLFPAEQQRIVRLLIDKLVVSPNDIEVRFRPNGIEVLALELRPEPTPETLEEAAA